MIHEKMDVVNNMQKIYRQGDVLLIEVLEIPEPSIRLCTRIVLEGEATGHAHRITSGSIYQASDDMYIDAQKGTTLVHDEHGPIELEPGFYRVVRQIEYDPADPKTRMGSWVLD
nr:hypothetical protein [Candidatus Sigynarchaeota archaeon]